MKNLLFLLVILIAVGSVHANALETKSPVGMSVVKSGNTFKVYYRGVQSGTVKVTIYNSKGQMVFVELMRKTENFMRPYNFSSLPEGDYTIELRDAQGKRYEKVTHSFSTGKRVAHLSRLNNENKFLLTVPNRGKDALTVKIFDARNTLLYRHTEIIEGNFGKVYNLNRLDGVHTFEVTDQAGKVRVITKSIRTE